MIVYGVGVFPLIQWLRDAHHRFPQPWYADDTGAGGGFKLILEHFWDLQDWGASQGYFPELTKSILVVAPRNVARAEDFFRVMGIKVVTGSRYLGEFVGNMKAEARLLADKVQGWMELVKTLLGVFCKHPHSAYAGLQNSLQ